MTEQDFPRDPVKFKTWADAACANWPVDLTAKAFHCLWALRGHQAYPGSDVDRLTTAYADYRKSQEVA